MAEEKQRKEIYVHRDIEQDIMKYLSSREIIAIVGPRQCGKTTLMNHIFNNLQSKKKLFLDFEDRETLELFVNDIKSFAKLYAEGKDYLFIDEFQYAKDGGKNLKYLFDTFRIKILISGSSASELSIQSISYLLGRIFVFTLSPFSFGEFLRLKDSKLFELSKNSSLSKEVILKVNRFYEEFLIYGGYPRVVISQNLAEKEIVLKNVYNTYLSKEIKEILNFKEDYKLTKLINALALQVGGLVNYEELSKITGFKYKELMESINILKKTFILLESKPYYRNRRVELVKSPKIFFIDSGFRNMVIKCFQDIKNRTDLGMLNENFVASELVKKGFELNYWRTKSNAEVDFVVRKDSNLIPIEAKSSLTREVITKSLHSFIDKYHPQEAIVLSSELFGERREKKTLVRFVPHWRLNTIL